MKIRQLDLIRIGKFTDKSLDFTDADGTTASPTLHLVYGPNEAGKSSTLRALGHWLFRMPTERNSREHFRHAFKELRVGGTLEGHDGNRLTCIRRPGAATSLRAEDDRTRISPERLEEILGGLTPEQFSTQFGIDLDQLERGGRAIAAGRGSLGESLFAAGSGIAQLPSLRKGLESKAEKLFKSSTATTPLVNAALKEFKESRQAMASLATKSGQWRRQSDELQKREEQKAKLDTEQLRLTSVRDRHQRIRDALPLIGQWREQRDRLESFAGVVRLPPDFATSRVKVETALDTERKNLKTAQDRLRTIADRLRPLGGPAEILKYDSTVTELHDTLSLYRQWVADRPVLRGQQAQLVKRSRATLQDLGCGDDLEQVDRLRLPVATRSRIRELAQSGPSILSADEDAKAETLRRRRELEKAERRLADCPEVPPTDPLARTLETVNRLGDLDAQIDASGAECRRIESALDADHAELQPACGPLAQIDRLGVPAAETIERFDAELAAIQDHRRDLRDERGPADQSRATAREELDALTLESDVPSEDELQEVRRRRDDALATWAVTLQTPNAEIAAEEIAACQTLVAQADQVSDRLRREAERVTNKARLTAVLRRCDEADAKLDRRQADIDQAENQTRAQWRDAWAAANLAPLSPAEMVAWRRRYTQIRDSQTQLREKQTELERLRDLRRTHIADLAKAFALPQVDDTRQPLETSRAAARAAFEELQRRERQRDQARQNVESQIGELERAEIRRDESRDRRKEWQEQWNDVTRAIDHASTLTTTEAMDVLEAIDKLVRDVNQSEEKRAEIDRLDQRIDRFGDKLNDLMSHLNRPADADGESGVRTTEEITRLVGELNRELIDARRSETQRDELERQQAALHKQLAEASAGIETHDARLARLCGEAKCDTPEQLAEAESQSEAVKQLQAIHDKTTSELRGLARGRDLDGFIEEAFGEDPDQLQPRIGQLSEQIAELEQQRNALSETLVLGRNELRKIDGNDKPVQQHERALEALAKARDHAEEYAKTKLGVILLKTAVRRYRRKNQAQVLRRASEIFRHLTCDAFTGLDTDSTDEHEEVLVAERDRERDGPAGESSVRAERELLHVEALSEGTRDQMFLALRLAALEAYLDDNPPVPFIVDDILLKFDDARSAATLVELSRLAERTQVIMFTHHRHLVDLARDTLPENRLHVHAL